MTTASDIEMQAMEWLVRLDALEPENASPENAHRNATVRAGFEAWCGGNTRRHATYIRLRAAWRKADQLRRLADPSGEVNLDVLAPTSGPLPPAAYRTQPQASGWRRIRRPLSLAAAVALIVLSAAAWLMLDRFSGQTYTTRVGGFERLVLADGSTVELDTDSKIRVRLTAERRHITMLRGRANFRVAPDVLRPFEVQAKSATVRALGTAFSVRLRDRGQIEVMVSDGRVAIATRDTELDTAQEEFHGSPQAAPTVSAGEAVVIGPARPSLRPVKIESITIARQLAWTQGRLTFDGETLREAVDEFNRYNRRKLVIVDPSIASIRVGGSFESTDPQSFVTALESAFGVSAQVSEGKEIHLSRAGE